MMDSNEAIVDFRVSYLINTLQILEGALRSADPRSVVLAQEALRELRLQTTTSEIYTETPLAEQIRTALLPDRIRAAFSKLEPKPIATIFKYTEPTGGNRYITLQDLTDHATIEEIVERIAAEIDSRWPVEIIRPGGQIAISKELLSYRFSDVLELSTQGILTVRVTRQESVGR